MRIAAIISIGILLLLGAMTAGYQYAHARQHKRDHCQLVTTKDTNPQSPFFGQTHSNWVCKTY